MAFKISEDCNFCDACVAECPNEAISEGDNIYKIDMLKCTECVGFYQTPQCADVCPMDCCETDPEFEEKESTLLARAKSIHPDEDFDENDLPSHFRS